MSASAVSRIAPGRGRLAVHLFDPLAFSTGAVASPRPLRNGEVGCSPQFLTAPGSQVASSGTAISRNAIATMIANMGKAAFAM